MIDVMQRLAEVRRTMPEQRLYALVDGAQYRSRHGEPLSPRPGFCGLFAETPDASLAHAGPWLVDAELASDAAIVQTAALEREASAVSWLIAPLDLRGLAQLLRLNLHAELPDRRTALLRFWDPRVLVALAQLLDPAQRVAFFGHVHEWHLLNQGQRVWIGRAHAQAQ